MITKFSSYLVSVTEDKIIIQKISNIFFENASKIKIVGYNTNQNYIQEDV
jgi:hypothetical protein